ncbi:hypothetical protein GCM10009565_52850 [Amycolatopsis albidoflavus]
MPANGELGARRPPAPERERPAFSGDSIGSGVPAGSFPEVPSEDPVTMLSGAGISSSVSSRTLPSRLISTRGSVGNSIEPGYPNARNNPNNRRNR